MQPQLSRSVAPVLKVLAFAALLVACIPLGVWIADPLTHRPLTWKDGRGFPILVVRGQTARLGYLRDSINSAALQPGETYLIPVSQRQAFERQLFETDRRGWVLKIAGHGPTSQHVELFTLNNGYWGGVYVATSSAVEPLYWKHTGPGFAFIFGGIATLIASAIWVACKEGIPWARKALSTFQAGPA